MMDQVRNVAGIAPTPGSRGDQFLSAVQHALGQVSLGPPVALGAQQVLNVGDVGQQLLSIYSTY
jgi:hypothetical protein